MSRDFPLESRKDKATQQGGQEFSQDLGSSIAPLGQEHGLSQ